LQTGNILKMLGSFAGQLRTTNGADRATEALIAAAKDL